MINLKKKMQWLKQGWEVCSPSCSPRLGAKWFSQKKNLQDAPNIPATFTFAPPAFKFTPEAPNLKSKFQARRGVGGKAKRHMLVELAARLTHNFYLYFMG